MKRLILLLSVFALTGPLTAAEMPPALGGDGQLHLIARERVADGDSVRTRLRTLAWKPEETAVVVCDMWDKHWCLAATRRVAEMAPRMNEVLTSARAAGALIVHCPSGTMEFYRDTPQYQRAQAAPPVETKIPLERWCNLDQDREGPLPIDDSDEGCSEPQKEKPYRAWTRQIATLKIAKPDAIADDAQAFYLMRERGIKNVIVMGVHTNMCVLGRPFAIRQLVRQGMHVVLMRDMTDSMYNPARRPRVSHVRGTELVVEHIERHWCPTILSTDFTGHPAFRFSEDRRPRVAIMVGEQEYRTQETLPQWAATTLVPAGYDCQYILAANDDAHRFRHIAALKTADLLLLSVRRRGLPPEQLRAVRRFVEAGKPVAAIRTSSHAFAPRGKPAESSWPQFDRDVLGGDYQGHYSNKSSPYSVAVSAQSKAHQIVAGWPEQFPAAGSLYQNPQVADDVTVLLTGTLPDGKTRQPVAWVRERDGQRIFYTSLGHPDHFASPVFTRFLRQAVEWALEQPGD